MGWGAIHQQIDHALSREDEQRWEVGADCAHGTNDSYCLTAFPTCDFGDMPHSLRCDDLPRSMNTRDPSLVHVPNLGWIVCVAFYELSVKAEEPLDLGLVEADGASDVCGLRLSNAKRRVSL